MATISSVNVFPIRPNGASFTITGTSFGSTQGTSNVFFGDNATYGSANLSPAQAITSWADTSITVTTANLGSLSEARFIWLFVVVSGTPSNAYQTTVSNPNVLYRTGIYTTASGTGTQVVVNDLPHSPAFVKVWWTSATTDDTDTAGVSAGKGFMDQDERAGYTAACDGFLNSVDFRISNYSATPQASPLVSILDNTSAGAVVFEADGVITSNGFSLDVTTAGAGYNIHYFIVYGRTAQCQLEGVTYSGSPVNTISLPGPPDVMFNLGSGLALVGSSVTWCLHAWGASDGTNEIGLDLFSNDVMAGSMVSNAWFMTQNPYNGVGSTYNLSSFTPTSTGGSWTGTNSDGGPFAFLWLDGFGVVVGTTTKPTGTAPQTMSITSLGFDPAAVIVVTGGETDQDQTTQDDDAWNTFGAMTSNSQHCAMHTINQDTNGAGSTGQDHWDHDRFISDELLAIGLEDIDGNGTNIHSRGTGSLVSDGFQIDFSLNNSEAIIIGYVAFEGSVEAAGQTTSVASLRRDSPRRNTLLRM